MENNQPFYGNNFGQSDQSPTIDKLFKALVAAQGNIEGAKKGKKNDHFRSKYADLASVWDACREALTDNGLAVIQLPCEAPSGYVGLITSLVHESGQFISRKFFMPIKDPTNPQAVGSAITYARRYALSACVGVCPEDDDGNAAAASPRTAQTTTTANVSTADRHKTIIDQFALAYGKKDLDEMKALYKTTSSSNIPLATKTSMLTTFGQAINELKGLFAGGNK